jgi:hypothetical protein
MARKASHSFGIGLAAVLLLAAASVSQAGMMLLPGQTVTTPGETYPPPGAAPVTALAAQTVSFSGINPNFGGTVSVEVFREVSGTLDFLYQVANASSSQFSLASVAAANFGTGSPFKTSVDFATNNPDSSFFSTGSLGAVSATRAGAGPLVTFNLGTSAVAGLAPGATSFVLFIQTDATAYNELGTLTVSGQNQGTINPGSAALNDILEPTAASVIPEPASALLLGLGLPLAGAWLLRRPLPFKMA